MAKKQVAVAKKITKSAPKKAASKNTAKPAPKRVATKAPTKKLVAKKAAPTKKATTKPIVKKLTSKAATKKVANTTSKKSVVKPATKKTTPAKKAVVAKPTPKVTAKKITKPVAKKATAKVVAKKTEPKKQVVAKKASPTKKAVTTKPVVKASAKKTAPTKSVEAKSILKKTTPKKATTSTILVKSKDSKETKKQPTAKTSAKPKKLSALEIIKTKAHVGTQHLPTYTNEAYIHKESKPIISTTQKSIVRYGDKDLAEFKVIITEKLAKAKEEIHFYQEQVKNIAESETKFSSMEDGSYTSERESINQIIVRQLKFVQNLENALARIENKTYGICRETGTLIPKDRLKAVPHATLSVEAKKKQK